MSQPRPGLRSPFFGELRITQAKDPIAGCLGLARPPLISPKQHYVVKMSLPHILFLQKKQVKINVDKDDPKIGPKFARKNDLRPDKRV